MHIRQPNVTQEASKIEKSPLREKKKVLSWDLYQIAIAIVGSLLSFSPAEQNIMTKNFTTKSKGAQHDIPHKLLFLIQR